MSFSARGGLLLPLIAALMLVGGCGLGDSKQQAASDKKEQKADKDKEEDKGHGWWCEEHGVPEAECILCSPKMKEEAKAKGDWCKHNRAKSQCFACDPSLKETFAAKYRAKYPGKEPPPATDND